MPIKLDNFKVGFIGLGKLGQPVFELMQEKYEVVEGYDPAKPEISVDSLEKACEDKDIIFVAVPTPHHEDYDGSKPTHHLEPKDFDYTIVENVLKEINEVVDNKIVCLISTVLPGTIRKRLLPLCENFELVYNPYLIGMGTVKEDFLDPEMMILGFDFTLEGYDAMEYVHMFYMPWTVDRATRWEMGSYEEAEAIKVFYNTFISAKIGLVNMIQDVGLKIGHMDSYRVANALAKSSNRIMSRKYMRPGMGDGGPCHPRDNIALRWLAKELDLGYDLFAEIMKARDIQAKNMADYLKSFDMPISIMSRNFKPETKLEDGSPNLLVGSYIDDVHYEEILEEPAVYLYPFGVDIKDSDYWHPCSIIVDATGKYNNTNDEIKVIHYGNV